MKTQFTNYSNETNIGNNIYTLEELKNMRLISNTSGRPTSALTDEAWQREFALRKLFIKPHAKNIPALKGRYSEELKTWSKERNGAYQGCTNWQQYCAFINDVLNNIRKGQVDYCYYIYQIMELARFHYDDLNTRYRDGYWEVWLD